MPAALMPGPPRLHCLSYVNRLLARHYLVARQSRHLPAFARPPLAWVTSGAPVEILRSMGIMCVYPENFSALVAARKQGETLCRVAEDAGYSPDLCSYARINLGSVLRPQLAPLGGLPPPDLLVACNNICGTVLKWYQELALLFEVPLFVLDAPFLYEEDTAALDYVRGQLEELIVWLEKTVRRRFQAARLEQVVARSAEATALWEEIRQLGRLRPSPINVPDLFVTMGPVVTLRGSQSATRFYSRLKRELETRVQKGLAAVPGERIRLLWDNIAIWYRLHRFFRPFTEQGACFVVDTYTAGWSVRLQGEDPLGALAVAYTTVFLNRSVEYRARQIQQLIHDFAVRGVVMHANRSCKPYSGIQPVLARLISSRTGAPVLIVEADMADPRVFTEEGVRNRVEAFLEALS